MHGTTRKQSRTWHEKVLGRWCSLSPTMTTTTSTTAQHSTLFLIHMYFDYICAHLREPTFTMHSTTDANEKKEEHQRRRQRRRRNALSKRKMRKINNSNGCDSFWQTQCDTLQESCCMTIVMDNFVEWMLFFSFFPFSSSDGFFPFVICLLLVAFSSICVEQQLRIVNKTGRRKEEKKVHSSLNAIYSCNWRLLTRCLHAVDNVTVQQMCGSWLKGNCHANRSAIIFNRKCSQPTK